MRARRAARGAATPEAPPPKRERPDYDRRFTLEDAPRLAEFPRRQRIGWNRERCLEKLVEVLQAPLERHNQDAYLAVGAEAHGSVVAHVRPHGGFCPLFVVARKRVRQAAG